MVLSIFITAIGLLLVLEGILPFLSPNFWRKVMAHMFVLNEKSLRIMGLMSMLIGLALVVLARDFY